MDASRQRAPLPKARRKATASVQAPEVVDQGIRAARRAVLRALYHDVGRRGSFLEGAAQQGFELEPAFGDGHVETDHRVAVPLPAGGVTWHTLSLAIVLPRRWIGIDFHRTAEGSEPLKARAFDLLHLKASDAGSQAVLVLLRPPRGGMDRDEVDAVAYGYDYVFGVDEANVEDDGALAALRSDLRRRILGTR